MPEDLVLLAWHRQNVTRLEKFAYRMNGPIDVAAAGVGITPDELAWFRAAIPQLCTIARGLLGESEYQDPAEISVTRRILAKTGPEFHGCQRWLGSTQGGRKDGGGGTPVIGYKGETVPARRLAWQLRYRGTDQELGPDDRLRNQGCAEGSLCMTLNHWYKPARGPALGDVRPTLAAAPLSEGRVCEAGKHWIERKRLPKCPAGCAPNEVCDQCTIKQACPACSAVSAHRREDAKDAAFWVGQALRRQASR